VNGALVHSKKTKNEGFFEQASAGKQDEVKNAIAKAFEAAGGSAPVPAVKETMPGPGPQGYAMPAAPMPNKVYSMPAAPVPYAPSVISTTASGLSVSTTASGHSMPQATSMYYLKNPDGSVTLKQGAPPAGYMQVSAPAAPHVLPAPAQMFPAQARPMCTPGLKTTCTSGGCS